MNMNDEQIKYMAYRFLGWKLPTDFHPDAGISFEPYFNKHLDIPIAHNPSGTNLFDANQAIAMVKYMTEGMPDSMTWKDYEMEKPVRSDTENKMKLFADKTPGPVWLDHDDSDYMNISAATWGSFATVVVQMDYEDEPNEEGMANAEFIKWCYNNYERLMAIEEENVKLRDVSGALLKKLDEIGKDDRFLAVWTMYHAHGGTVYWTKLGARARSCS